MSQNIVEYLREQIVTDLFRGNFINTWSAWKPHINALVTPPTGLKLLNLGDNLYNIFSTTKTQNSRNANNSQSHVANAGASWENLVCWYLNLCLIGTRTVVIKHKKEFIPEPISDAITVNYSNFISNTESDLVAITFPDNSNYAIDKELLQVRDNEGNIVPVRRTTRSRKYNLKPILDSLAHNDFTDIEIHIIQCKTNWKDNAQIPMLWDMIYSADRFRNNITLGRNGYTIRNCNRFTYSFVTVPTGDISDYTPNATQVVRVRNLTGGNYWGRPTLNNVASSLKEMLNRNLANGMQGSHINNLNNIVCELSTTYSYFDI